MRTYPNLLIFSTSSKVSAIRAETDASDVEITVLINGVILECAN